MNGMSALHQRFEKLQTSLTEKKLDAVLITSKIHWTYLLGFSTESSSLLFIPNSHSKSHPTIITSPLEAEIVKAKKPWNDLEIVIPQETLGGKTKEFLQKKKYRKMEIHQKSVIVPDNIMQQEISADFNKKLITALKVENQELTFPGMDPKQILTNSLDMGNVKLVQWEDQAVISPRFDDYTVLCELLRENQARTLGIEFEQLTYQNFIQISTTYKKNGEDDLIYKDITTQLQEQRLHKDSDEIELMKKAAQIGDIGFTAAEKAIHECATELDVAAEAEYAMRKAGSEHPSFETIVVSGNNSAFPHGHATEKRIDKGDLVTVDLGAVWKGYCSDMTRTIIAGNVAKPAQIKILRTVNKAHDLALDTIKIGGSWAEADKKVREFYKQEDVLPYYNHSLGHGVGVEVHESPWINYRQTSPEKKIEPNMVFTIEPGLYMPGKGGARTEDTIVITPTGFETLTKSKIEEI